MNDSGEAVAATRKTGRIAGALYLLSAVTAGIPNIYVPGSLIVAGNAGATSKNILASETLFRASMVSELVAAIVFIFLVRTLYRLLERVDQGQASLMVTLVLVSVPITFINVLSELGALALFRGADFLSVFGPAQRDAMAMLLLGLHGEGVSLANVFWGLWLFPFGVLVFRSAAMPRILGLLLILNGFALVFVSLTALLRPDELDVVNRFAIFPELGELWMMAWLLIKGVNVQKA